MCLKKIDVDKLEFTYVYEGDEKRKSLFKYVCNSVRFPRHEHGFKGVLAHTKSVYMSVKKSEFKNAKSTLDMLTSSLLEYLNSLHYYFGYPLISISIILVIGVIFSLAQAGCVLVAFAIFVEGFISPTLKNRLEMMETANKANSLDPKAKYLVRTHLKNLQSIHPNILTWSLLNAVIGTLLWGFSPQP